MMPRMRRLRALLVLLCIVTPLAAAPPGVDIQPLLRTTPSLDPERDAVVVRAVFAPGSSTGRHSHPGDEYATVIEGQLELRVDGLAPQRLEAGQAYHNARGVLHETVNPGAVPARVVSTFIVPRGQALVQPAP